MGKKGLKYISAQQEMSTALSSQQTISINKLKRLLNNMNISIQPGKTTENVEVAYLKSEIKKRDKTINKMSDKIKRLTEEKMHR